MLIRSQRAEYLIDAHTLIQEPVGNQFAIIAKHHDLSVFVAYYQTREDCSFAMSYAFHRASINLPIDFTITVGEMHRWMSK